MNDIDKFLRIQPNKFPPTSGKILVVQPLLQDPYFARTTIFIIDNNKDGTFGFILNTPTSLNITDFDPSIKSNNIKVYFGGPVENETLFFLHTFGDIIPDSSIVIDGIYFGGNWDIAKQMLSDGVLNENNFRLFIGYSGWIKNQLDDELKNNSWVVSNIDIQDLFSNQSENLWDISITKLGKEYAHWKNFPISPEMN